jgi:hypothetical protein
MRPFDKAVLSVCKDPRAYTLNGTFGEVWAYLEGFGKGEHRPPTGSCFAQLTEAQYKKRYYKQDGNFWNRFRKRHRDDATAIAEFARLWVEWRKTPKGIAWERHIHYRPLRGP